MNSDPEKVLFKATVVFLVRETENGPEVLLARKTRKIGAGCFNGYGGGIDPTDKNKFHAAAREVREETSPDKNGITIDPSDLEEVGFAEFHNNPGDGQQPFCCECHFFITHTWEGEPKETEEMSEPTWFPISNLPLSEMMPADAEFVPRILTNEKIHAVAHYGPRQKSLLRPVEIRTVEGF